MCPQTGFQETIDRFGRPWSTRSNWRGYVAGEGEDWLGFACVRHLVDVPDEVLMVPLAGHTFGHAGIAVDIGGRWMLMAVTRTSITAR